MGTGVDGLISGLDTTSLIDSMIEIDRASIVPVEENLELAEAELEAVQNLNLKLLSADTDLYYLRRSSTFSARECTVSDEDAFSATASSQVQRGSYAIRVDQLAQAQQLATDAVDAEATVSGTLSITVGDGDTWSVTLDEDTTLSSLVAQINGNSDAEAQLLELDDGTVRLILAAGASGADNTISLDGDLVESGGLLADMSELSVARDAEISITLGSDDPIEYSLSSSSNSFEDVMQGLDITVSQVTDDYVSLTVSSDPQDALDRITSFVETLNASLEYYVDNASYDSDSDEAGILFSNGSIRGAMDALVRSIIEIAGDEDARYRTLSSVGLSYDETTGLFELDETALEEALELDPDAVEALFVDSGLADAINDKMDVLTESVDGVLAGVEDRLVDQITAYEDRIEEMDERLETRRARYEAEFTAMEQILSELQTQESYIEQFAATWNSSSDD